MNNWCTIQDASAWIIGCTLSSDANSKLKLCNIQNTCTYRVNYAGEGLEIGYCLWTCAGLACQSNNNCCLFIWLEDLSIRHWHCHWPDQLFSRVLGIHQNLPVLYVLYLLLIFIHHSIFMPSAYKIWLHDLLKFIYLALRFY